MFEWLKSNPSSASPEPQEAPSSDLEALAPSSDLEDSYARHDAVFKEHMRRVCEAMDEQLRACELGHTGDAPLIVRYVAELTRPGVSTEMRVLVWHRLLEYNSLACDSYVVAAEMEWARNNLPADLASALNDGEDVVKLTASRAAEQNDRRLYHIARDIFRGVQHA